MLARRNPEEILNLALNALSSGPEYRSVLDELPAPIYITDENGAVVYWNSACIEFAGREPQLGHDRWCVTWKLYTTTGEPLPKDKCPMAQAIKQGRAVRESIAVAERPDGSRVAFKPYPTPLFDEEGNVTGALNMLIDVTGEQAGALHEQAERCRRLAGATYDRQTAKVLGDMADGFDRTAENLANKR